MRARQLGGLLAVACLASVTLAGCGSASDVASSRPVASSRHHGQSPTKPSGPAASGSPGTPGTSMPSSSPGSGPHGSSRRDLPHVVGALPVFLTPSRNIGCMITESGARCDIDEHVYKEPPKPAGCHGDYGQSVEVTDSGIAGFACVTDTVMNQGAPVLKYGTSTVVGDFGCTSLMSGIRCYYLKSQHGFWLSQEHPALF